MTNREKFFFFGFPGTETLGGTNLHQIMIRQKNYEDLIINSEQYVFSAEHNWIHYVDAHPNGEGNKLIYETLNNFRLDIY